jgi:aspartyl-tRNA(Asn)/glutamyl-tRNA(Gln) amidotransferase subunit A
MTTGASKEDISSWSLARLSHTIREGELSPVEVTRHLLERIESANPALNAYITVAAEEALAAASRLEKVSAGSLRGPLHGVPVGLKDIVYTRGLRTTMGSESFQDYVPGYNATVVERLEGAGAIIIGKLNTHQFAYGPTGDRSYFGPVRNPYDAGKISGGSSSGAGAAVASGLCYAAVGTDTGGSVRIPASCCGIVGMKPTFGRVSKHGIYPLSWTLDHPGPMTRTVEDNAILLGVLSGYDKRDPYSAWRDTENFTRHLVPSLEDKVIGVPSSFYFDNVEPEVSSKVRDTIEVLSELGAEVREVELPRTEEMLTAQRTILAGEAFTVHYDLLQEKPDQYEEEVRQRLLAGEAIQAREYINAQQLKHVAIREFNQALEEVDVLASPTLPVLPTGIDQREVDTHGCEEHVRSALTRLTGPTNLNGFPSLSVPCGFSESSLPIGLQFMGKAFDEIGLYQLGYALETATYGT